MDNAFRYILANGITTSSLYPYQYKTSSCNYNKNTMKPLSVQSFSISASKIIFGDCNALEKVLKVRPVTVVVSVDISFIFYSSGVLNTCGNNINHAIQLVGIYRETGSSSNKAYYIGKNSWGVSWGMGGFIYIDALEKNGNLCSVCTYPQYME